ncbi:hypothetical protein [Salmonirosea aquatica]|uniref:Esterase-like activity of phytase family protein n=1 Tax=Salmonirosea aquatica TaxID=2654236 RepID=A0A7C9F5D0_9BACT|nr:hypothetical protein [Cytophagaceae bacterium SJW1-29]
MKNLILATITAGMLWCFTYELPGVGKMEVTRSLTVDSLGACQGVSFIDNKVFLYGDREVGVIREYSVSPDSLVYSGREYRLTVDGKNVINHPTGIAYQPGQPVFMGNSIRLNPEGTLWKAVIYQVDWPGLQNSKTLDGNLLRTIEDDACIQGTRPEYVQYKGKWYVATADYGDKRNEVRLYDPEKLKSATKTSEPGVLYKKFTCGPWVQNLHWLAKDRVLVLIQNQIEGRKWRFTYLDLEKSLNEGTAHLLSTHDLDKADELEGFAMVGKGQTGIAVTSSRKNNVHLIHVKP